MAQPFQDYAALSRAYERAKSWSMLLFAAFLILWCILYGGTIALAFRVLHLFPMSNTATIPISIGFLVGGMAFAMTLTILFNRKRIVHCPHCNGYVSEIGSSPDPVCGKCGKSVLAQPLENASGDERAEPRNDR